MRQRTKIILAAALVAVSIVTVLLLSPLRRIVDYGAGASGYVVDGLGKPVEGAIVAVKYDRPVVDAIMHGVSTESAVTGKDGRFSLINFSCNRPGPGYTVTAAKAGMRPVSQRGGGIGRHRLVLRQGT